MKLNEQNVRQYLLEHPEFALDNSDVLAMPSNKVKDFREAQLAKIQADNQSLNQRQQQWLQALGDNQKLATMLWHSAAELARVNTYKQVLHILEHLLCETLNFPEHVLKLFPAQNKRPVPADCVLPNMAAWGGHEQVLACAHLPTAMQAWFVKPRESFLVLPLQYHGQSLGFWAIASDQVGYFNPQLDTTYLEAYVQVLAATLARIMGVNS